MALPRNSTRTTYANLLNRRLANVQSTLPADYHVRQRSAAA
jgi:hypothetical protein